MRTTSTLGSLLAVALLCCMFGHAVARGGVLQGPRRSLLDTTRMVCPDVTGEARSSTAGVAWFYPYASVTQDGASIAIVHQYNELTCTKNSGDTFQFGNSQVSCSYNGVSCTFTVQIRDTTPPYVSVPYQPLVLEAASPTGTTVNYPSIMAHDDVDGTDPVTCFPGSGSTFQVGSNTVRCSSTDSHGNTGTNTFTVKIQDTTPPKLTLPASITTDTPFVSWPAPTATDNSDTAVQIACNLISGSRFPSGTTQVQCSATDKYKNVATSSFTVTVIDQTAPVMTIPSSKTWEATSASGASVQYAMPTVTDNIDVSIAAVCSPKPGSTFPIGTTTVNCQATDRAGNSASGSFSVTVQDTTPPTLKVSDTMTVEATSASGSDITFTAFDIVDGSITPDCNPASGSTFGLGVTTVTCTSTDTAGNQATGSFNVNVRDTTSPNMVLPELPPIEATSASGSTVTFTALASDAVSDSVTVTPVCDHASGSTFGLGVTTVTCTSTDTAGNQATGSFNVNVRDTTSPNMVLPELPPIEATSASGSTVTFVATAFDAVSDSATVTPVCSPASGSTFGLGVTTVTCTSTDTAGNQATGSFNVNVRDTISPNMVLPELPPIEATSASGSTVTFTALASDAVSDSVTVAPVCDHASGSTFGLGVTTVTCTSTDTAGNQATGTFSVNVRDTTKPDIQLPSPNPMALTATGPDGVVAVYSVSASDKVSGSTSVTCASASGSVFPIGRNKVSCSSTDNAGNTNTASFDIIVRRCPNGLLSPLDTTTLKSVSSSQTLPIKFSLGGYYGMDVIASQYPMLTQVQCDSLSTTVQDVADTTAIASLSYDAASTTYTLPFSLKGVATKGACYRLRLMLTTCLDMPYDVMIQVKS